MTKSQRQMIESAVMIATGMVLANAAPAAGLRWMGVALALLGWVNRHYAALRLDLERTEKP